MPDSPVQQPMNQVPPLADYDLTAASLGMHRVSLYRLFRELGIPTKRRQLAALKGEPLTGTPIEGAEG